MQHYRALFETQPTPKLSIHVANSSLGKSRRVLSMRDNNYQRSHKTRNQSLNMNGSFAGDDSSISLEYERTVSIFGPQVENNPTIVGLETE